MPSFKMKPPSFKLPSFKLPFFKRSKKSEEKAVSSQPPGVASGAQPFIPPVAKFDDPAKPPSGLPSTPPQKEKPKGFKFPAVNLSFLKKKPAGQKAAPSQPSALQSGGTSVSQPDKKESPVKSLKSGIGSGPKKPASAAKPVAVALVVIVVAVIILAVAGSVGMTGYRSMQSSLQTEKQQVTKLTAEVQSWQQEASEVQITNDTLSKEVAQISRDLEDRDQRVSSLQTQLMTSVNDIEKARKLTGEIEEAYAEILKEQDRLTDEIKVLHAERDKAREQLAAIEKVKEAETSELLRTVLKLRERLTLLDRDYRELADKVASLQAGSSSNVAVISSSSGPISIPGLQSPTLAPGLFLPTNTVELPPIIVRKNRSGMALSVSGRLVEVNDSHDFVVLDKGSMDGVHMGMTFDIIRGTSQIGRAKVIRVRPKLAACDVIRSQSRGSLQVGDRAVQRGMK